ncbi:MAG: chitobiase/beta-hexosaminidase C-terminal domain-containing protein [Parcubacteria group bacterium]|nr:chitobiase/beta-hexosaminidase C-terminal domain-containing protein [Parcubacteria group bacterium]
MRRAFIFLALFNLSIGLVLVPLQGFADEPAVSDAVVETPAAEQPVAEAPAEVQNVPAETTASVSTDVTSAEVSEPATDSVNNDQAANVSTETGGIAEPSLDPATNESSSGPEAISVPTDAATENQNAAAESVPDAAVPSATSEETAVPSDAPNTPSETPNDAVETIVPELSTWIINDDGSATTRENVQAGVTYRASQNDKVTVTFASLPETPGTLTVREIKLSAEEQATLGAFSDTAYEITSTMQDGTFEYDLTLPLPASATGKDVEVRAGESVEDLADAASIDEPKIKENDVIKISGLNHFTVFVVTTVVDFNNGSSSGVTVTDIGSGNGDVSLVLNAEAADQSNTTGTTGQAFDNGSGAWLAQTFTVGQSGFLSKVTLLLKRGSNTEGDVTVEIRNTVAAAPGTTTLASKSVLASTLTNASGGSDVDFIFSSSPTITAGSAYAIVIYRSGSGTLTQDYDWFHAPESGADEYGGGGRYRSTNNGVTWTSQQTTGNGDFRFKTYYRAYTTSGNIISAVLDSESPDSHYDTLSWDAIIPAGTSIDFSIRASNSSFLPNDAVPAWTSLGSVSSPIDISSVLSGAYRYFEWKAALSGTANATPILHIVTTAYNRPPNTPVLATPTNESITSDNTPDLSWTAASPVDPDSDDTVTYDVQIDNNSDFSSPEYSTFDISGTSATASTLSDGLYYFRARAVDSNGYAGNWSSLIQFTIDTTAPTGTFTINNDAAYATSRDVTLNFSGVSSDVTQLEIRDGTDGDFQPPVSYANSYSYTLTSGDEEKTLSVRFTDAAGNQSVETISDSMFLDTASPSTGDSGTDADWHNTGADIEVVLTCDDGSGSGCANTYYTTDGSEPSTSSATGNSVILSSDGQYTVKYFSADKAGNQEAVKTAANTVKIDKTKPSAPGLPSVTTSEKDNTPTWTWSASSDAGSGLPANPYSVQWCDNSDFEGCDANVAVVSDATFTNPDALADGTWYFRVKAIDVAGNESEYSPVGSAVIDTIWRISPAGMSDVRNNGVLIPEAGTVLASTTAVTVSQQIIISVSSGSGTSTVSVPASTVISRIDGAMMDATLITSSDVAPDSLAGLGSTKVVSRVVKGALQWGIVNMGLQFSVPITLSIFVGDDLDGQTLHIVRSVGGNSDWTNDGIAGNATCTVDAGICTFQATKASYYAATQTSYYNIGGGRSSGFLSLLTSLAQSAVPAGALPASGTSLTLPEAGQTMPAGRQESSQPSAAAAPGFNATYLGAATSFGYVNVAIPPTLLAAVERIFGVGNVNMGIVVLAMLFGPLFYWAYDLIRKLIYR